MKLSEWLSEQDGEDRYELARRAIREDVEMVVTVVAEEIEHIRRSWARTEEENGLRLVLRAMGKHPQGVLLSTAKKGTEPVRLTLPRTPFALGDGTKVTWGEATAEQHQQRVALLKKQIVGLGETVSLHQLAIKRLEETGAKCLDELLEDDEAVA